jgi:hypothetical protein
MSAMDGGSAGQNKNKDGLKEFNNIYKNHLTQESLNVGAFLHGMLKKFFLHMLVPIYFVPFQSNPN